MVIVVDVGTWCAVVMLATNYAVLPWDVMLVCNVTHKYEHY